MRNAPPPRADTSSGAQATIESYRKKKSRLSGVFGSGASKGVDLTALSLIGGETAVFKEIEQLQLANPEMSVNLVIKEVVRKRSRKNGLKAGSVRPTQLAQLPSCPVLTRAAGVDQEQGQHPVRVLRGGRGRVHEDGRHHEGAGHAHGVPQA